MPERYKHKSFSMSVIRLDRSKIDEAAVQEMIGPENRVIFNDGFLVVLSDRGDVVARYGECLCRRDDGWVHVMPVDHLERAYVPA